MEGDTVPQFGSKGQTLKRKRRHEDRKNGDDGRRPRSQQPRRRKRRMNETKSQISVDNTNPVNCKGPMQVLCSVCNIADPKYKCPKCRSTYCSIICCRKHKEEYCSNEAKADNNGQQRDDTIDNEKQSYPSSKYLTKSEFSIICNENKLDLNDLKMKLQEEVNADEDLGPGWQMTQDMIQNMRKSKWLKDELSDCGLQKLILKIVSSSNNVVNANRRYTSSQQLNPMATTYREQMLSNVKSQCPQFQIFVNKLLYLTGIYERCDSAEIDMKTPIDEWLINSMTSDFILKPLPQRNRPSDTSLTVPCDNGATDSESVYTESENHDETHDASDSSDDSEESSTA